MPGVHGPGRAAALTPLDQFGELVRAYPALFALLAVGLIFAGGFLAGRLTKRPGLYVRCPVDGKEFAGGSPEAMAAFMLEHERLHPGEP